MASGVHQVDDSVVDTLEEHIKQHSSFEQLPSGARQLIGNSREVWKQCVFRYSIKHQLRWKTALVRSFVTDEKTYYLELIKTSRNNYMLYPYHISDVLVRGLRFTPFRYYYEMMFDVMMGEKSYDVIPNFTAADIIRLLGIGRNQYIDIMNKWRSRSTWQLLKKKESAIKELLPTQPVRSEIDYWWTVCVGFVSEEDIRNATELEHSTIDLLIDRGPRLCGELDKETVYSLHAKGLIYLQVTIKDDDQISVPPLENFIMNRVLGDYFENLLYKIFVSIDERTTIRELATTLQVDIEHVKNAVSMYILLGFAKKKTVDPLLPAESWLGADETQQQPKFKWHTSWLTAVTNGSVTTSSVSSALKQENNSNKKRIGFIFDSSLTAFLMMGNLATGLKSHAVTMFEVGKLADEALDDFVEELGKVESVSEGEAQRYFDHAITLKNTLRFLRKNENLNIEGWDGGVDLLRSERLKDLEPVTRMRILRKNYGLLISMAPISTEMHTITSCVPPHFGPVLWEINSPWFRLFLYNYLGSGLPSKLYPRGSRLNRLPSIFQNCDQVLLWVWEDEPEVISTSNLLVTANDALLAFPIFIQAYSYRDEPEIVDVPFPLDASELNAANSNDDTSEDLNQETKRQDEYTKENMQTHPIVRKLHHLLKLDTSCGVIRMLKLAPETGWMLQTVHYGIPLYDPTLNSDVCNRLVSHNVLHPSKLEKFALNSRLLCLRLLEFIESSQKSDGDLEAELEYQSLPFPNREITFFANSLAFSG